MLSCIIIDDERPCVETLRLMLEIKFFDLVRVAATTTNPAEAVALINGHRPDLLFLDVEMPHITGIELLQSFHEQPFYTVFTTAHQQYALPALKSNALDYLLKPIDVTELGLALAKCGRLKKDAGKQNMNPQIETVTANVTASKKVALPSGNSVQLVPATEIIRIESLSNYSIVFFTDRPKFTIARTLKEFEEQLSPFAFLRVHHSHLINLEHVIGYKNTDSGYVIMKGNDIIEISRRKKQEVLQRLNAL